MRPTIALAWIALAITLAGSTPAGAQKEVAGGSALGPGIYPNSWALVIGIDKYQSVPGLSYAVADARSVAAALPSLGFPKENIRLLVDGQATKRRIERVLYEDFGGMGPDDRLLVFFAGHGETLPIRGGEEGYLLPVDANPTSLPITAIPMDDVKRISQRLKAKHYLFVMDACFSGFAVTRDIAPARPTDEYLAGALREPVVQVLTAGRKGERAIEDGGHGLFTRRLLDGLRGLADTEKRGFITAAQLATWIEPRVVRDSKGKMTPQYGKLDGEGQFVFVRPVGALAVRGRAPGIEVWLGDRKVGETGTDHALVIPNLVAGSYKVRARKVGHRDWEREIQVAANQRAEVVVDIEPLAPAKVIRGEDGAVMVLVPAGEFVMGSDEAEVQGFVQGCPAAAGFTERMCKERGDREMPQHRLKLDAFYIDQHEVTNALFEKFVKASGHTTVAERERWSWIFRQKDANRQWEKTEGADWRRPAGPGSTAEANRPVIHVAWSDADAYCRWAGKRLPTEAEWEKAARGTDGRRYPWGNDWEPGRANATLSARTTTAVGSFAFGTSPYGAHDMAGNVYEWVADWFDKEVYRLGPDRPRTGPEQGTMRVIRGGSWHNHLLFTVIMRRPASLPERTANDLGFRCAKGL